MRLSFSLLTMVLAATGFSAPLMAAQPDSLAVFISRILMNDPVGAGDLVAEQVQQLADYAVKPGRPSISRIEFGNAIRGCQIVRFIRPVIGVNSRREAYYQIDLECDRTSMSFLAETTGDVITIREFEQYPTVSQPKGGQ